MGSHKEGGGAWCSLGTRRGPTWNMEGNVRQVVVPGQARACERRGEGVIEGVANFGFA
jgi:hypothetical protein